MISTEDLRAISARAAAASPGPWRLVAHYDSSANVASMRVDGCIEAGPCIPCGINVWEGEVGQAPFMLDPRVNGEFVAHAREDVPALVVEVERLRAALERIAGADSDEPPDWAAHVASAALAPDTRVEAGGDA